MVWGTLAGIKYWLGIPTSNTQHDTELTDIQSDVNTRMSMILRRYCDPASLSADLTGELADIEDEWAAGVFRIRRAPASEAKEQPFVKEATERLEEFVHAHFKKGFWKTALKAVKGAAPRHGKGTGAVVKW